MNGGGQLASPEEIQREMAFDRALVGLTGGTRSGTPAERQHARAIAADEVARAAREAMSEQGPPTKDDEPDLVPDDKPGTVPGRDADPCETGR